MFDIIVAIDKKGGIGKNNDLPWNIPLDMNYFKRKTLSIDFDGQQNAVIMGYNTWLSIPEKFKPLKNRINIIVTQNHLDQIENNENVKSVICLEEAYKLAISLDLHNIFIIGGKQLYNEAFSSQYLRYIYITKIDYDYNCDVKLEIPDNLKINESSTYIQTLDKSIDKQVNIKFQKYEIRKSQEYQYLDLMTKIINKGDLRSTRNASTISIFGEQIKFDISESFPLLTTKRMFWKGIVEELLFFIRGETNSKKLEEKGVNIWKGNTSREFLDNLGLSNYEEGQMGPMYGYQWRNFNKPYNSESSGTSVDQLRNCINLIRNDPTNRRIMLTTFNPAQLSESVLAPCHSIVLQFYVNQGKLSTHMYQRSADTFLGLPFNIASTSLLTILIAKITNLQPGEIIISLGDTHLYASHKEAALKQLRRVPFKFPKLEIKKELNTIEDIENMAFEDFILHDYQCHPGIKAEMFA